MSIDPGAIASGVVQGIATQKTMEAANNVINPPGKSHSESVIELLTDIRNALQPKESYAIDMPMALQPAPYYYQIEEDWHGKSHFCMLVNTLGNISILTEGAGVYTRNITQVGWYQVDLRGELYSGDAGNKNVIISYRDDALGSAF